MSQSNGKKWNDLWRLASTSAYVAELTAVAGIPVTELARVVQGGTHALQGTCFHPYVASAWPSGVRLGS